MSNAIPNNSQEPHPPYQESSSSNLHRQETGSLGSHQLRSNPSGNISQQAIKNSSDQFDKWLKKELQNGKRPSENPNAPLSPTETNDSEVHDEFRATMRKLGAVYVKPQSGIVTISQSSEEKKEPSTSQEGTY